MAGKSDLDAEDREKREVFREFENGREKRK